MNKFLIISIAFFLAVKTGNLKAQTSVYSGNSIVQSVDNQELNSAPLTTGNNLEIGAASTVLFSTDIDKEVQACNEIRIQSNAHLVPPSTSTKSLSLGVVPDKLEIYSLSHTDITQVHAIERFETTVELPQGITDAIAAFKVDDLDPEGLNPFMDWDVDLKVFYQPVAYPSHEPKLNHGFYYEEYDRLADPVNSQNSDWTLTPNSEGFRVRLSFPELLGEWEIRYELFVNGDLLYQYCPFYVNVIAKNSGDGFVKVAENNRVLERDNDLFLPIGHNAAWPGGYVNPNDGSWVACDYACEPCESESFEYYYNTVLQNYADENVDFIRLILSPESIDIEYEKIGNYFDRLNYAWEIDNIIEFCEANGIYIDFNMLVHYGLVNGPVYGKWSWDWGTYTGIGCDCAGTCYEQKSYCYFHDLGVPSPVGFCTQEEPKKYYKQKIRYLISRYGYSSNIAMFELMSEINQVGMVMEYDLSLDEIVWVTTPYNNSPSVRSGIYKWQKEMAEYIKGYLDHDQHILTGNYAGFPQDMIDDYLTTNTGDRSFGIAEFDVVTYNEYTFGDMYMWEQVTSRVKTLHDVFGKPVILSEIGRGYENCTDRTKLYNEQIWRNFLTGACGFSFWGFRDSQFSPQHQEMYRFKDYIMNNQGIKNTLLGNWKAQWTQSTENVYQRKEFSYIQSLNPPHDAFGALFNLTDNYFTNIIEAGTICDSNSNYNLYYNNPVFNLNPKEDLDDSQSSIILNYSAAPVTDLFSDFYGHNTEWINLDDYTSIIGANGHTENYSTSPISLLINHPPMYVEDQSVLDFGYHGIIPFTSQGNEFVGEFTPPREDEPHASNSFMATIKDGKLILFSISEESPEREESIVLDRDITVIVTNLLGQKVFEGQVLNPKYGVINSEKFPKGVLLINIIDGTDQYSIRCVNL